MGNRIWNLIIVIIITMSTAMAQVTSRDLEVKPKTLDAALHQANVILDDSTKLNFKKKPEGIAVSQMHNGFGFWMRNNWGLYSKKGKLAKYFHKQGIMYASDISLIILTLFHRQLNEVDLNKKQLFEFYKSYRNNPKGRVVANSREVTFSEKLPLIDEDQWQDVTDSYEIGKMVEGYIYREKGGPFRQEKITILSGRIIEKTDKTIKIELTSCSNPKDWPDGCGPGHVLEVYPSSWEVVEFDFTEF